MIQQVSYKIFKISQNLLYGINGSLEILRTFHYPVPVTQRPGAVIFKSCLEAQLMD